MQTSYKQQQQRSSRNPNQFHNPPNNNTNYYYPNGDMGENEKSSNTWCSKPLCLGLTRLSGGILFGTMIFLTIASLGGLFTSVVLYVQGNDKKRTKFIHFILLSHL